MKQIFFLIAFFFTTSLIAQSVSGVVTNVSCNGGANGTIDVTVTGGVSPFTYDWSHLSGNNNPQDVTGLTAGIYTVTVTGSNGGSSVKGFQVDQPAFGINLNTSAGATNCFGGTDGWTELVIWGGQPPYQTQWSNGATTEDLDNIPAGSYAVTVTDANQCIANGAVNVGQPAPIQLTTQITNGNCGQVGALDLNVSGGTPGYTYDWSNDGPESPDNDPQDISGLATGTYTVTVTDSHGCPATTSATITGGGSGISPNVSGTCDGANISNLAPGTYTMTITNSNGCTATATFTVACNLTLGTSVTNVSCSGGNNGGINLTTTGGVAPYTFHWNTGSSQQNLNNLPAGTYTVTVTDATGTTKTTSATVTQPTPISVSANVTNVSTNGGNNGSINLSVFGGTPGYTFNWSNGAWTEDVNNLQAGTYTVTVTDVNWCTATISALVSQPAPCVSPDAQFNLPVSGGLSNLQFSNTSTGSAPMTWEWWFGDGGTSTDFMPTHTYAQSGVYLVTLRATNACGQDLIQKTLTVLNGPTPAQEPGNNEFNFIVGPNPTTDKVFVKATGDYEVLLVATNGQIVHDMLTDGDFEISLGNLPPGIYFMNILSEGKLHKSFPVVKQ